MGTYWDNGKENGRYYHYSILGLYRDYIRLDRGYIGIMENRMEKVIL